jgi:hypothetical protein
VSEERLEYQGGGEATPQGVPREVGGQERDLVFCPTCRSSTDRTEWRTVLRQIPSASANHQTCAVLRHRLCNTMAYVEVPPKRVSSVECSPK